MLNPVTARKIKQTLIAYLFMAPALIVLIVFVFLPIILGIPLAFTDYSALGAVHFIGFQNFINAVEDHDFWTSVINSAVFVLVVPPLQLLAIILSVVVNKKVPGITFFRVLFYIPVVTSMIAVSIMWSFIFDPHGMINKLLMAVHLINSPIYFLNDVRTAMLSLMFVTIWQGIGYYMMLYLAGLQSIPKDYEEAAKIDGANAPIAFFRITLPLLKPYIWFCSLFSVLAAVGVFDVVFAMTKGGPDKATLVINYYTYTTAFSNFKFGYASAIGLFAALVSTLLSMVIFFYGRKGGMSYVE